MMGKRRKWERKEVRKRYLEVEGEKKRWRG